MKDYEKIRKRIDTQLAVNSARLERRIGRLETEDVLNLYEEGSNLFFSGRTLEEKMRGSTLIAAAVHVLVNRFEPIANLDLTQPFPLRNWINGIPASHQTAGGAEENEEEDSA